MSQMLRETGIPAAPQEDAYALVMEHYRASPREQARFSDLMRLIPSGLHSALDIGARDGYMSKALAGKVDRVTALDLDKPSFTAPRVTCVQGDATALQFPDRHFDLVFCAEVLEHIPTRLLDKACAELSRVAGQYVLIGVPYKQDIRKDQTTCYHCGAVNPPWAHVNSFDERRLQALFPHLEVEKITYVETAGPDTNGLSAALMNFAGNPYGTYGQEEPCVHCGHKLTPPPPRNLAQKVATKGAVWLNRIQDAVTTRHANWIHVLFRQPQK